MRLVKIIGLLLRFLSAHPLEDMSVKRLLRMALICAVILQVFATASHSVSHAFKRTVVGQEIDGFVLPTLDGEEVELYPSLGTKATLVIFWAAWSPRSAEILKDAQAMFTEHGTTEFNVMAVNVEHPEWVPGEASKIKAVGDDAGATYKMVLDKDLEVFNHYGVVAVPSSMILDKDGKVLNMLSGYASMTKDDLKDGVLKALGKYIDPEIAKKADPNVYKPKGKAARHYNMANRLVKKKRHKRALKPIMQALKEDPDYADAYRVLALIHEKTGESDKAAEAVKKADELDTARGVAPKAAAVAEKVEKSSAAKMLEDKMKKSGATGTPATAKPAAAKPAAAKPAAAKPAAAKPAAAKPAAAKPVAAKPVAAKPATAKPVAAKDASATPVAGTKSE
jgi:peroxiredoxin